MMEDAIEVDYSHHYLKWHSADILHYDKLANHYQWIMGDLLGTLPKTAQILDVGCGMGGLLYALRKLGFQNVSGVDVSPEQVASTRELGLPAQLVGDTVAYLTSHPRQLDLIAAFDVLEHIPVDRQIVFIRAIHAALKPGGRFICTVPNANSAMASRWRYIDWTHYCSFTEHSLDFVLFNGGFRDVQVSPLDRRPRMPLLIRKSVIVWLLRGLFRALRRLEMSVEIGFGEAKAVPLSINLRAVAKK